MYKYCSVCLEEVEYSNFYGYQHKYRVYSLWAAALEPQSGGLMCQGNPDALPVTIRVYRREWFV